MALVPSVRVTSRVQCCRGQRQSTPSPRCRSSLALSPRCWLTPPVDWSRRTLHLGGNQIESVADVTWPSSLVYLILGGNPLGCFQGVPEHVVIDHDVTTRKTTRCPSNCTIATFYDASADACLPCGAGTFVVGVGAVMCSRVATASTVTSSIAVLMCTRCMCVGLF
jgi:hypothetical protein